MYKDIGIRVHIVDGLNILYRETDGVCAQDRVSWCIRRPIIHKTSMCASWFVDDTNDPTLQTSLAHSHGWSQGLIDRGFDENGASEEGVPPNPTQVGT